MKQKDEPKENYPSNIHIQGQYAAGRDIVKNVYAKFKWLIFTLLALAVVFIVYDSREDIRSIVNSQQKFAAADSAYFRILLLPFKPDQECTEIEVDYKGQLIERLERKKQLESLAIKLLDISGLQCPVTHEEAREIGLDKNADLVIWGSYEETPEGPKGIRLRYTLMRDFKVDASKLEGDTEMQALESPTQLRQGYLQQDVDYILHWVQGLSAFNVYDYQTALQHFEAVLNDTLIQDYEVETYAAIGNIFKDFGRYDKAEFYYLKMQEKIEEQPEKYSLADKTLVDLSLAAVYQATMKLDTALTLQKKVIQLLESQEDLDEDESMNLTKALNDLGVNYSNRHQYQDALNAFDQAINYKQEILRKYGADDTLYLNLMTTHLNIGHCLMSMGSFEKSIKHLEESLTWGKKITDELTPKIAEVYNALAVVHFQMGHFEEAMPNQKMVVNYMEKALNELHPDRMIGYNNLATFFENLQQMDSSVYYQKKAIHLGERILAQSGENPWLGILYSNFGVTCNQMENYDTAKLYFYKAIDLQEQMEVDPNLDLAVSFNGLCSALRHLGEVELALEYIKKAVEIGQKVYEEDHPNMGKFYMSMSFTYLELKKLQEARYWVQQSLNILSPQLGPDHMETKRAKELKATIQGYLNEKTPEK